MSLSREPYEVYDVRYRNPCEVAQYQPQEQRLGLPVELYPPHPHDYPFAGPSQEEREGRHLYGPGSCERKPYGMQGPPREPGPEEGQEHHKSPAYPEEGEALEVRGEGVAHLVDHVVVGEPPPGREYPRREVERSMLVPQIYRPGDGSG